MTSSQVVLVAVTSSLVTVFAMLLVASIRRARPRELPTDTAVIPERPPRQADDKPSAETAPVRKTTRRKTTAKKTTAKKTTAKKSSAKKTSRAPRSKTTRTRRTGR